MTVYDPLESAMPHIRNMVADQLRTVLAHAAGLHTEKTDAAQTVRALENIVSAHGKRRIPA